MRKTGKIIGLSTLLASQTLWATSINVDCDTGDSLADALNSAPTGTQILANGTCAETLTIHKSDITGLSVDSKSNLFMFNTTVVLKR